MLVALHAGIALALILSGFIPLVMQPGLAGLNLPTIPLLSAPFVLMFLCLVGMRSAYAIPVEPKANWVVRLLEPRDRSAAVGGAGAAMVLRSSCPLPLLAGISSVILLRCLARVRARDVLHVLGWFLTELLVLTLLKIPFTCTYYPRTLEAANLLAALSDGVYDVLLHARPLVERAAFSNGAVLVWTVGLGCLAIAAIRVARSRRLRALTGFRFEEEDPEVMFQGFKLSEGLAAGPRSD